MQPISCSLRALSRNTGPVFIYPSILNTPFCFLFENVIPPLVFDESFTFFTVGFLPTYLRSRTSSFYDLRACIGIGTYSVMSLRLRKKPDGRVRYDALPVSSTVKFGILSASCTASALPCGFRRHCKRLACKVCKPCCSSLRY